MVKAPKGLNEGTVRYISVKKGEPDWMLAWRLDGFKRWLTMREPTWANVTYPKIDFQKISIITRRPRARRGRSRSPRSIRSC